MLQLSHPSQPSTHSINHLNQLQHMQQEQPNYLRMQQSVQPLVKESKQIQLPSQEQIQQFNKPIGLQTPLSNLFPSRYSSPNIDAYPARFTTPQSISSGYLPHVDNLGYQTIQLVQNSGVNSTHSNIPSPTMIPHPARLPSYTIIHNGNSTPGVTMSPIVDSEKSNVAFTESIGGHSPNTYYLSNNLPYLPPFNGNIQNSPHQYFPTIYHTTSNDNFDFRQQLQYRQQHFIQQQQKQRHKRKYKLWSEKEDRILVDLKKNKLLSWKDIAKKFSDRTLHACQFRWRKISPYLTDDDILEIDREMDDEEQQLDDGSTEHYNYKDITTDSDLYTEEHENVTGQDNNIDSTLEGKDNTGADPSKDDAEQSFREDISRTGLKVTDILN